MTTEPMSAEQRAEFEKWCAIKFPDAKKNGVAWNIAQAAWQACLAAHTERTQALVAAAGLALHQFHAKVLIEALKHPERLHQSIQDLALEWSAGTPYDALARAIEDAVREANKRWQSQIEASLVTERRDCEKALLALAGWYPTPQETYGTNTSWAISDLCRAVGAVREAQEEARKLAEALEESLKGCRHVGDHDLEGNETTTEDGYIIACGKCEVAGAEREAKIRAALAAFRAKHLAALDAQKEPR